MAIFLVASISCKPKTIIDPKLNSNKEDEIQKKGFRKILSSRLSSTAICINKIQEKKILNIEKNKKLQELNLFVP